MYIEAKVTPGSRKETLTKLDETHYKISVREPAARNLANTRVRELIARACGVNLGRVRIVSGHRSPKKIIDVS